MSLSNQQYESIMRRYEKTQTANRYIWEERLALVYDRIPAYRQLDARVGSVSVEKAKCLLDGDENALSALHDQLEHISRQKKKLLTDNGFSEDYLQPVYTCKDCHDTGYVSNADNIKEKCHCLRQQELSLLYEQSNIQNQLSKENFSVLSYEYYQGEDLERFENAVKTCLDFTKNFKQDYRNLFFYGTVGTGKSFLSGCIANELLKSGHSVIYFSSAGLFDTLSHYTFDIKAKESLYNFYEDLYNCELVILDDLGTEMTNTFVASQLFSLLNERHLRQKATIISTNLNLEEIRDRYSDRVFSRITSNYTLCKLSGTDIRIYQKRLSMANMSAQ